MVVDIVTVEGLTLSRRNEPRTTSDLIHQQPVRPHRCSWPRELRQNRAALTRVSPAP